MPRNYIPTGRPRGRPKVPEVQERKKKEAEAKEAARLAREAEKEAALQAKADEKRKTDLEKLRKKLEDKAGKPQNERVLNFGELNPKQRLFCESKAKYTCYGGARGGGKSHVVRIKAVGGCFRYPGIKVLIVRKTYPDLQGNHIEPIQQMVPGDYARYNGQLHTMYFKNGSMIRFGHYDGDAAELEYQGQEYDWIFLDEATQFTERQFRTLGALLRGVNNIPKRFYLTCNPGGRH